MTNDRPCVTLNVAMTADGKTDTVARRGATPEEIAAMILYLCSEEAQAVNGARIPLYGSP